MGRCEQNATIIGVSPSFSSLMGPPKISAYNGTAIVPTTKSIVEIKCHPSQNQRLRRVIAPRVEEMSTKIIMATSRGCLTTTLERRMEIFAVQIQFGTFTKERNGLAVEAASIWPFWPFGRVNQIFASIDLIFKT